MSAGRYRYLFGPVPSRRLGRSLGVDLLVGKICSYDCVYCQVGRTASLTAQRREIAPTEKVWAELEARFAEGVEMDYVTFSGSGEPTLHTGLGTLIARLKDRTPYRVAVLTNGSLLWMDEVRRDLARADLVVPSLDAAVEEVWRKVNRPAPGLEFARVLDGLRAFCAERGEAVALEILLVAGVNDSPEHLEALARLVRELRVERVQLNTVTRPPSEDFAAPVPAAVLESLASMIGERCEVIRPASDKAAWREGVGPDEALAMLRRRPCTVRDVAAGLGVNVNEAAKVVGVLVEQGRIKPVRREGLTYYLPA